MSSDLTSWYDGIQSSSILINRAPFESNLKMNVLFEWDEGNTKHVLVDHPERGNTIEEVESILQEPNRITKFDRLDSKTGEPRYFTLGVGTEGIVKYVAFVVRNGKIRPITCHQANKKQRAYYERANTTSSGETEKGSGGD